MDYERKYKDALQRAKHALDCDRNNLVSTDVPLIYSMFPELKESEDEKTRKAILTGLIDCRDAPDLGWSNFGGINIDECIAWLEKQSEVTKTSGQELKPKFNFKVGQWIVATGKRVYLITKIDGFNVTLIDTNGDEYVFNISSLVDAHLWTINDAKDGDVLAYVTDEEDLWIMIYRSLYEPYEGHIHYHALLVNDDFSDKGTCCICIDNLKPATKEQRDLLFHKMKEAGYEWDSKNKELKKIESKKLDPAKVIAWLVANIVDFEYYVKLFKQDFGL